MGIGTKYYTLNAMIHTMSTSLMLDTDTCLTAVRDDTHLLMMMIVQVLARSTARRHLYSTWLLYNDTYQLMRATIHDFNNIITF